MLTTTDLPETLTDAMDPEADTEAFHRSLRDDELRPDIPRMTGRPRSLEIEILGACYRLGDLSDIVAVASHHTPVGKDLPRHIELYST